MAKQTQFATTASLKGLSKGYIPPKDSQCYNLHVPPTSTHMLKTGFQRMKDSAKLVMVRQTKPSVQPKLQDAAQMECLLPYVLLV